MFSYPTNTDIPKHNIHLFPFISLQRDDHSGWNFCCDLLRSIWFGAFQNRRSFGHLLFGLRFPGEIVDLADPEGRSTHFRESWIMIRYAGCFGIMMDFFKTTLGFRSDQGQFISELLRFFWYHRQTLFTSLPLHYFDLKSDWLPLFTFLFGSPPEDLLFLYLLFVPIR